MGREGYTVLVDGYNVIKRHASWAALPLAAARARLLDALGAAPWPVPVDRIIAVFDAQGAGLGSSERPGGRVAAEFARSADAALQERIRRHAHPDRLLVISDDRDILDTARSHGALRYPARWLTERGRTGPQRAGRDAASSCPSIPASAARRITEELAKRWLDPPRD